MRGEIALRAYARDLGRHVEERVGHLAGDHVDLVVERHGDDHVGLLGAGPGKDVGMRAVPDIAAYVERLADDVDERRRGVDDGNVVRFL